MSESLVYEKKRRCFYSVTRANLNKNHCVIRGKKEGEGGEKEGGEKKERKKRKSKNLQGSSPPAVSGGQLSLFHRCPHLRDDTCGVTVQKSRRLLVVVVKFIKDESES
jgi:hypothetical protein